MLSQTFSFWRKFLGHKPEVEAGDVALEDDRRVWVRYPANLEATLQPARADDPGRFAARVRDISRGGVNLVLNRAFQPGQILSLELPIAGEPHNVLACIVRVTAEDQGEWALGCVFSRELGDEDLQHFGACRQQHEPPDQRTWLRFRCNVKARYQPAVAGEEAPFQPAQLINISPSGVGLLVAEAIEAGTLLNVELVSAHADVPRTMLACVVHVAAQGPAAWALGCNFIHELNEDDLQALVESSETEA